jgi:adenosine deaminase
VRELASLPKAHLHLHLEAGMSPGLLAQLATKYERDVPVIRGYGNFGAFSETYVAATDVLREREDWELLADELCRTHRQEGAVHLEPAFWAGNHRNRFDTDEECWDLIFDVFASAAERHDVSVKFIVAVDRVKDTPDDAVVLARFAVANSARVVGLGLHNDEVGHPPAPFADAFRIATEGGLLSVPHAGELEGGRFVAESIDLLGATRIGHGVRSTEVPGLVERLVELEVCLEVCPTSNIMLGVFPSLDVHPLPALLDAGVQCSVNADDPLLFGPTLLQEYQLCRDEFGFDDERMARIARSSIEHSVAPDAVKAAAFVGIDAWLAAS